MKTTYDAYSEPTHNADGTINGNHAWTIKRYGNHENGFLVYSSKAHKGQYFSQRGGVVSVDVARSVGFPVDADLQAKERQERLAKFTADLANEGPTPSTVLEDIGYGRANVTDPDGKTLNPRPMGHAEAAKLFTAMVSVQ